MSSQYGEHERILEYFGDKSIYFLDLGAYDGVTFSNTIHLTQRGSTGVLVEPDPEHFMMLKANYDQYPNACLVNAGITPTGGIQEFWKCEGDIPSTFCADRRSHFSKNPYSFMLVSTLKLEQLLNRVGDRFDFVNIDVEGLCFEMLEAVLDQVTGLRMLSVETDPEDRYQEMRDLISRRYPNWKMERIGGNLLAYE